MNADQDVYSLGLAAALREHLEKPTLLQRARVTGLEVILDSFEESARSPALKTNLIDAPAVKADKRAARSVLPPGKSLKRTVLGEGSSALSPFLLLRTVPK